MTTDNPQTLHLDQIRTDGGTQPRVLIDEQVVSDYAALYSTGVNLPPVTVFFDGATYWLADGFHRYWANKQIDCEYVFADVHQGTQRDAILYSVGANAGHGLRRTSEDKRKAVLTILTNPKVSHDDDGNPWSNNAIAQRCQVDPKTVASVRAGMEIHTCPVRKGTDGKVYDTSNMGRPKRSPRRPKPGGISPNAMMPVRGHSTHQPKVALELPHDPHWAARAVLSAMGQDFARALITELTAYLEGATE